MADFFQDAAATFAARIGAAVFGVLATIIIARSLGPEGQGIFSLAILLPATLLIFTTFGVNISATYFTCRKDFSLPQILGGSIFFSLVLGVLTAMLGFLSIWHFHGQLFKDVPPFYLWVALFLIPFNLAFELFLPIVLGAQRISSYNYLSLLQSFLFFIFSAAAAFPGGIIWFIAAQIASFVISAAAVFLYVLRLAGGKIEIPPRAYLKEAFSYGIKNYLGGVIVFFHYRIDAILVNYFINPFAVGIYFAAAKLAESVWLVSQSASRIYSGSLPQRPFSYRIDIRDPLAVFAPIDDIILFAPIYCGGRAVPNIIDRNVFGRRLENTFQ